jgi:hypothetical protein
MYVEIVAKLPALEAVRFIDNLEKLLQPPPLQPFRFRHVTIDLRQGFVVTGDIEMFQLHDDKGADVSFGPPGNDTDGNPAVAPKNLQVAVVETPPFVVAAMLADGSGFSVDAIPGLGLGVSTVRVTNASGFTQDFGITIVAEDGTVFPNAAMGAERPTTATAGTGTGTGGTPAALATSFPGATAATDFTAAVAAYQSAGVAPTGVTLDGTAVGNTTLSPVVNYFTHSDQGGAIDTTGPTS